MHKPSLAKLDILVVDPSPHMASLIGQMLRHLKVRRVDEAQDSDQAAARLQTHRYGAIMLSNELLPIRGIALVRALRQATDGLNRDTPVIMMSSEPDVTEIAAARDAGITEFLRKPFATGHVETRLKAILVAPRPFIETEAYAGPDRRRRRTQRQGSERRNGD